MVKQRITINMPRIAREKYESNYFHIITQGLNREYIFRKNVYKKIYKDLFIKKAKKRNVKILSYCIMDNHTHIVIHCKKIQDLSEWMHNVNTDYGNFYNKEEGRVGYVFRDRFVSEPILDRKHLLNCIAYVHNNPVKAGIVREPYEYDYSSFIDYVNKKGIVNNNLLIELFGTASNYLEHFYSLHRDNYSIFAELYNKKDYGKFIKKIKRIDMNAIKGNRQMLEQILKQALELGTPRNVLAKTIGIDLTSLREIIKQLK